MGAVCVRAAMLMAAAVGVAVPQGARAQTTELELRAALEHIRQSGRLEIEGTLLTASSGILQVYQEAGFRPLWTDTRMIAELNLAIEAAQEDGLQPHHYFPAGITRLASRSPTGGTAANIDLLRTDALIRLIHDIRFGRATLSRPASADASDRRVAPAEILRTMRTGQIAAGVRALRPGHFMYDRLVAALADLRRAKRAGGWSQIPDGPALRLHTADARVPLLRQRLTAEGYRVSGHNGDPVVFDTVLDAAVRIFQHRHGLNEDGVVGPSTRAELNVPIDARMDQIRVNLERARWVAHGLPETFLAVNVAGAKAYLIRNGSATFESRAVVGATSTRTPVFKASLSHVVVNPTWTVPRGIVSEVLAAARRDRSYLQRNRIMILDSRGSEVHVPAGDLARYSARSFPYVFQQAPGPANPLGSIKLVFPNPYNVYVHDTPARELFTREQRTFSHGCIRVQDVAQLAVLVLDDTAWTRESIEAVIRTGRTRTIALRAPLPVLILYWTASTDLHGELHYYRDVYERDASLLQELD
jgi:murein L,D-transpeptidase YcbB/YkuD